MLRATNFNHILLATVCAFGLVLPPQASHGQTYTVKELKPLPGGNFSEGRSMNASGVATGDASDKADALWAALWGTPGAAPNVFWGVGNENYFHSINSASDTVGEAVYYTSANPVSYPILAAGSQFSFLPTPGYNYGAAYCIADHFADKSYDGSYTIVGAVGNIQGDPSERAVAWKKDGTMLVLDTLPGGDAFTSYNAAYSIDRYGLIGGSSAMNYQSVEQAVVWGIDSSSVVTWFNDPARNNPGIGGAVRDIRDDWYFAGYYFPTDPSTLHACYWDGGNTTLDIGTLYGGSSMSLAVRDHTKTLNNRPEIVGWSDQSADSYGHFTSAFIWDPNNNMRDLNKLIPANSGWQLDVAYDIDPQGRIVGAGRLGGQNRGFMLLPVKIIQFPLYPGVLKGGGSATASLTLMDNAPTDEVISLSSSSPYAVAPRRIVIPKGRQSVRFIVKTSVVRAPVRVTLTAVLSEQKISTNLTITP